MAAAAKPAKPAYELSGWELIKKNVVRDKWLFLLILPGMLFMLIFRYIPIFGNVIAFMDFNPYNMWNSTWVGFDQFIKLFNKPAFMQTFYNTLYISILKMVCGFPIPIILALMMNEMRNNPPIKIAASDVLAIRDNKKDTRTHMTGEEFTPTGHPACNEL